MSVRLPPQVELMRDETVNTFSASSMIRSFDAKPHTCVFLPKQNMSGSMPKCWNAHIFPVMPTPACTSSKINSISFSSHSWRMARKNSGRKWLSPPSPWIGSMMKAAISSLRSCRNCLACSIAIFSRRSASASASAVAGKWIFGFSMRGQSNFGKYCVLRGSVFVSESV